VRSGELGAAETSTICCTPRSISFVDQPNQGSRTIAQPVRFAAPVAVGANVTGVPVGRERTVSAAAMASGQMVACEAGQVEDLRALDCAASSSGAGSGRAPIFADQREDQIPMRVAVVHSEQQLRKPGAEVLGEHLHVAPSELLRRPAAAMASPPAPDPHHAPAKRESRRSKRGGPGGPPPDGALPARGPFIPAVEITEATAAPMYTAGPSRGSHVGSASGAKASCANVGDSASAELAAPMRVGMRSRLDHVRTRRGPVRLGAASANHPRSDDALFAAGRAADVAAALVLLVLGAAVASVIVDGWMNGPRRGRAPSGWRGRPAPLSSSGAIALAGA